MKIEISDWGIFVLVGCLMAVVVVGLWVYGISIRGCYP